MMKLKQELAIEEKKKVSFQNPLIEGKKGAINAQRTPSKDCQNVPWLNFFVKEFLKVMKTFVLLSKQKFVRD